MTTALSRILERAIDLINAGRIEPVPAIIEGLDSAAYT
jgi:hypothetical protein